MSHTVLAGTVQILLDNDLNFPADSKKGELIGTTVNHNYCWKNVSVLSDFVGY